MAAVEAPPRDEALVTSGHPARRAGLEQLGVTAGQLGAGAGNLAFALLASRLLSPGSFAELSAFLGLYLISSLPAASISAAAALDPDRGTKTRQRILAASLGVGAGLIASAPFLGPALNLPVAMIALLGLTTPAAGPLALERGRLYGWQRHRQVVASLLTEPGVRLSAGVALAAGLGGVGGAAGVVLAAYAALEVARTRPGLHWARRAVPRAAAPGVAAAGGPRATGWTAGAFGVLAVVQNQDLLFANRLLPPHQAGAYAALSTLGGAAAFATVTIPLVLLPRAAARQRHAVAAAVGLAGLLGLGVVAVAAAVPRTLTASLFGARYETIGPLVVPYLLAMALLGVARVLVAERCAAGSARLPVLLTAAVAGGQATAIALVGHSVAAIAWTTVGATGTLAGALATERFARLPAVRCRLGALRAHATQVVVGAAAIGLGVRLVILRGIWLDEATSIHQASMPFGAMIQNLRTTDVHPPLYFSVLWVTERLLGDGSLAMRTPSIIAGSLIVPAAFVAGRDLWDRRTGVVAACLAAVAPMIVWYSQEARMYSMFMLFALLAVWGQARALRRGRAADWALYALASAALAWTEYFGLLQLVAQQLVFLGVVWARRRDGPGMRRLVVGWVAATVAVTALLVPLAPFAWHQFAVNQTAGKGFGTPSQVGLSGSQPISVYTVLANLAWAVVGYHSAATMAALVALWPLGILAALVLLGRNPTVSTTSTVVVAVVPTLLLLGLGMTKRNLFDIRYLSGVVVALLLLLARLLVGTTRSRRLQLGGCVAVVAVLAGCLVDEQVNGANPRRYDFAGAVHAVDTRYRPGDVLVYDPDDLGLVVGYYAPRVHAVPFGQAVPPGRDRPEVRPGTTVFVLASKRLMHAGGPTHLGSVLAALRAHDREVGVWRQSNVTVWAFHAAGPGGQP